MLSSSLTSWQSPLRLVKNARVPGMYAKLLCSSCVFSTLGFKAPGLQPLGFFDRDIPICRVRVRGLSTDCCHTFECQHRQLQGTPAEPTSGQDLGVWGVPPSPPVPLWTQYQRWCSTSQEDGRLSSPTLSRAVPAGAGRDTPWCIWRKGLRVAMIQAG